MKKKIALACLVAILCAGLAAAQDYKGKGRVGGIVTDEDGNPIEGVTVKLFSLRAQDGITVQTDKDGKWLGAWIRSGGWNIDFVKIGYAPKKVVVEISESKRNPDVSVTLTKVEGLVLTDEIRDLLTKGNEMFDAQDYAGALAVYEDILAKYPDAYPISMNVGNAYFAQEKYDLAEESYKRVIAEEPDNVAAIIAVGNCYANRGQSDQALEWYGKVEFEKIEDPTVLYNLGTNYYNNAKFEEALKFYQKAVAKQKESTDALYQLGLAYLNLQRKDEAIAAFEDYLKIDAESGRADQVRGFLDYLKK
ncbi:MAG TPA: tetratricopeptide repeat protein [Candidatus Aminicenantes bacterium]|nr:tetratricopeptide repeat protein [Candidatus Aminicenantes bacterium]HDT12987.1 tetratricopeptide repeat protein [Candidatus Aminicenantes bacterium]